MKKCPACDRTYVDDTLSFCLEDGSVLYAVYDEQVTVVRGADDTVLVSADSGRPVNPSASGGFAPPVHTTTPSSSTTPHLLYAMAVLIGLVIIGVIVGGVLWMTSGEKENARGVPVNSNQNPRGSNVAATPTVSPSPMGELTSTISPTPTPMQTPNVAVPTPTVALPTPTAAKTPSNKLGGGRSNTALDGSRITYYPQPSLGSCASACASNGNCKGYTWIAAGTYNPGDSAMCYLLSSVTRTYSARGHTSGVKGAQ